MQQKFDDYMKNSTQIAPRSGPSRHFVFGRGFVVGSCQDPLTWPGRAHWHWTVWHSGTDARAKLFGDSNCIVFSMLCKGTSCALMAVQRFETWETWRMPNGFKQSNDRILLLWRTQCSKRLQPKTWSRQWPSHDQSADMWKDVAILVMLKRTQPKRRCQIHENPSVPGEDSSPTYWDLWRFRFLLFHQKEVHTSPIFTAGVLHAVCSRKEHDGPAERCATACSSRQADHTVGQVCQERSFEEWKWNDGMWNDSKIGKWKLGKRVFSQAGLNLKGL